MIKPTTKQIASNENTNAPQLQFSSYEQNKTYRNDGTIIDFVTDGKSLYVCAVEMAVTSENTIEQEIELHGNFLKVISQGEQGAQGRPGDDGAPGATPNLTFRFDGKQLVISENGQRKAVSPDLAGPSWRPVLNGRSINWTLSKDTTAPQPLNIDDITVPERPLLLRTDSDNTRRLDEESGPARFIQWKYEGEEEWRNLISISELMNLALAGVSFWREEDGWHFGHKEVISATYSSDASGNQIISNVELGNVLFDAGTIPASLDGDALAAGLEALQDDIAALNERLNNLPTAGDATKDWVRDQNYATQPWVRNELDNRGYATQSWVNSRGFLSEHQHIKTLNGQTLVGDGNVKVVSTINNQAPDANGNINIIPGDGGPDVDLSAYATMDWVESQGYIKNTGTLTGLVKAIKVNAQASVTNPDANGLVTLNLANDPIVNLQISDGKLYKWNHTGTGWQEVGNVGGTGGTGGLDENAVRQIVTSMINDAVTNTVNNAISGLEGRFVTITVFNDAISTINSRLSALEGGTVLVYRTFTAYKWSVNTPSTPGQVSWNPATSSLPVLSNNWTDHPENKPVTEPADSKLWMTTITLSSDGTAASNWSDPINLTANPGVDGNGVEFIYKLYADITAFNTDRVNVPSDAEPLDSAGHWYDHPQGISENETIEAASMRTYDGTTGTWSHYCTPFIWSMWGEDGMDGDGVEYIFYVAGDNAITRAANGKATLNYSEYAGKIPLTAQEVTNLGASYQIDDWCPDGTTRGGFVMPDYNWTDNPSDVDSQQPYEFVCIRKYNGAEGKWGPFSEPKLWGYYGTTTMVIEYYGQTNTKKYMCYAFHRTNNDISNYRIIYDFTSFDPTHYTINTTFNDLTDPQKSEFYENPLNYIRTLDSNNNVVNIAWSDGLPTDSTEQLWLIQAWIGDESQATDTGWTSPVKWGDQAGIQIEYAVSSTATDHVYNRDTGYTLPNLSLKINGVPKYETDDPTLDHDGDGIDESLWRSDVQNAGMGIWNDEKSTANPNGIEDPDYMAMCIKRSNGTWSDWQISRIKGEKGDPGPQGEQGLKGADGLDGTGLEFVYYRTKGTKPGVNTNSGKYSGSNNVTSFDPQKDDWLPAVTNIPSTQYDNNSGYWNDHPSGVDDVWTHEWYITRASHLDANGKRYWDNYNSNNVAIWSQWAEDGKDGDGIEYIFTRSAENSLVYGVTLINPTTIDTTTTQYQSKNTEFIPTGWTDDPQGVDSVYKYEWVSIRKYRNEQWTAFSTPVVWAKWGEQGQKGDDGRSFNIRTSYVVNIANYDCDTTNSASLERILYNIQNPQQGDAVTIQIQDQYNVISATEIWYYTGETGPCNPTDGLIHGWHRVGELVAGSAYVHQKFANETEIRTTSFNEAEVQTPDGPKWLSLTPIYSNIGFNNRGEFPGKYVGMYTDNVFEDSEDISDYNWVKWSGDDGFGMEQIFTLDQNAVQHKPTISSSGGTITTNVSKLTIGNGTQYTSRQDILDHYYDYDAVPTGIGGTNVWYDRPLTPTSSNPNCYVSVRKLDVENLVEWSEPVVYTTYARNGVDGKYVEYVYHTSLDGVAPTLNQNSGYIKSGNSYNITTTVQQPDFLPGDGTANGHWTDNPSGVSKNIPYEFVSVRKYDGQTNTWGAFSTPTVWSHFGENGEDGDGMEYVFFTFSEEELLGLKWWETNDGYIPSTHDLEEQPIIDAHNRTYIDDEFLPVLWYNTKDNVADDKIALDDNPGASLQYPYIYYSTRKEVDGSWEGVQFEPIKEWFAKDYDVDIVTRQFIPIACDYEGNVSSNTTLSYPISMTYDGETVNYPRYWDININNNNTESTNSITIGNTQYLYAGALKRSECTVADGSVMYKWKNNNTFVYTDTMYPTTSTTAYTANGTTTSIRSVNCTTAIKIVGSNLTINTSNLPWNNDQVVVTLTGHFTNMYNKYASKQIVIIKNTSGTPGTDGEGGNAYILETNYKVINLSNIPSNFKARVLNNGVIDSGWTFNVTFFIGNTPFTSNLYYSVSNNECSVDIEEFLETRQTDTFDNVTITASKSGYTDLTITVPTVKNGSSGVPYFFRGEWQPNNTYYHNNQRIDIVKRTVNNVATYYICDTNPYHNSNANFNSDLNAGYWKAFDGNYENIATTFLFAEGGYIEDLRVHSTQIDGELKAAEITTSDLGNGKITINQGGATWDGNNAILGYAANSTAPGIMISGKDLSADVFRVRNDISRSFASSCGCYIKTSETSKCQTLENLMQGNTVSNYVYPNNTAREDTSLVLGTNSYTVSQSSGIMFRVTQVDTIQTGLFYNNSDLEVTSGDTTIWPDVDMVLVKQASSNYSIVGSLGKYHYTSDALGWEFDANGTISVTNGTYYIGLVPSSRTTNVSVLPDSATLQDGLGNTYTYGSIKQNIVHQFLFTSNDAIILQECEGSGIQGVTIAPNGLLVYFNDQNYLQFVNINGSITAHWKVNNTDLF